MQFLEPVKDVPNTGNNGTHEYRVTLCRKVVVTCSVEAESPDEAARKARFFSIVDSFWEGKPDEVIVESVEIVESKASED